MTDPIQDPDLFEHIILADKISPGLAILSGHERVVKWDVKEGNGQDGGSTTLKGFPPGSFTVNFYLTKDESFDVDEFADWEPFADLIWSTVRGKTPKALDIYHPDLARNDYKSVTLGKMGGLVHDGKGGANIAVLFQEYRPPKPKGGSPRKPVPSPREVELNRLTLEFQKTPWG